jgi:hypothetical protein
LTSEERHEARYQRRKAKREAKAKEACGKTFDEVMSFGNLCKAGKECCAGSRWKSSTINFEANMLAECLNIWKTLDSETRKFTGFHSFSTVEHGKERDIDALAIQERTAQKCLTKYCLTEAYSRSFIYENAASLEDKGMDFAIEGLVEDLHHHYRLYGTEGGIYQFDFKGYFGSLRHDEIKARARKRIQDDKLYRLFCQYVDDFQQMKKADRNAEQPHGVGLGSEVSQIIALDYANPIDHYFKDVRRVKGYGRYMDDGRAISNSLEELRDLDRCLHLMAPELGLTLSEKKCVITSFRHHSFTFLKLRFTLEESGKVTVKLSRNSIKAMRRKLDIFRKWLDQGTMGFEDIAQSYQSWRAHASRCDSYRTVEDMDARFVELFREELRVRKGKFKCHLRAAKKKNGWVYTRYDHGRKDQCSTSHITA